MGKDLVVIVDAVCPCADNASGEHHPADDKRFVVEAVGVASVGEGSIVPFSGDGGGQCGPNLL